MTQTCWYEVADFTLSVTFLDSNTNNPTLLPSFVPFEKRGGVDAEGEGTLDTGGEGTFGEVQEHLFDLVVDDSLPFVRGMEKIRDEDTGNGISTVYRLDDGGYQYVIRNIAGFSCCLLQTDKDFRYCRCALRGGFDERTFGLNNALMLIFAFAGSRHQTLLIHASCVVCRGKAYPFIAKSGTGKSTHTALWLKHIDDTELINDDNPIVRIVEGCPILYGSPWSGKTHCYKNMKAPLGAVTRIVRGTTNTIESLSPIQAFGSLLSACSLMKWDEEIYGTICDTVSDIVATVASYTLHCLPDEDAARLCHKTIT